MGAGSQLGRENPSLRLEKLRIYDIHPIIIVQEENEDSACMSSWIHCIIGMEKVFMKA